MDSDFIPSVFNLVGQGRQGAFGASPDCWALADAVGWETPPGGSRLKALGSSWSGLAKVTLHGVGIIPVLASMAWGPAIAGRVHAGLLLASASRWKNSLSFCDLPGIVWLGLQTPTWAGPPHPKRGRGIPSGEVGSFGMTWLLSPSARWATSDLADRTAWSWPDSRLAASSIWPLGNSIDVPSFIVNRIMPLEWSLGLSSGFGWDWISLGWHPRPDVQSSICAFGAGPPHPKRGRGMASGRVGTVADKDIDSSLWLDWTIWQGTDVSDARMLRSDASIPTPASDAKNLPMHRSSLLSMDPASDAELVILLSLGTSGPEKERTWASCELCRSVMNSSGEANTTGESKLWTSWWKIFMDLVNPLQGQSESRSLSSSLQISACTCLG